MCREVEGLYRFCGQVTNEVTCNEIMYHKDEWEVLTPYRVHHGRCVRWDLPPEQALRPLLVPQSTFQECVAPPGAALVRAVAGAPVVVTQLERQESVVPAPAAASATANGEEVTATSTKQRDDLRTRGEAHNQHDVFNGDVQLSNTARHPAAAAAAEDELDVNDDGGNGQLIWQDEAMTDRPFQSKDGTSASFDVKLFVRTGDHPSKMLPFRRLQLKKWALSIDSYVAPSSLRNPLSLQVTSTSNDGATYACKVFIDTPCKCESHRSKDDRDGCYQADGVFSRSFLIGPEETDEVIIEISREMSRQFVFCAPPCYPRKGLDVGDEENPDAIHERLMKLWPSFGGIRVEFFAASSSSRGTRNTFLVDNVVFDNVIVFEKRIQYATVFGYVADIQRYFQSVGLYMALPLDVLQLQKVRELCIAVYMNKVAVGRTDADISRLQESVNQNHSVNPSEPVAAELDNSVSEPSRWVKVPDLFRAIINDLSPAGSYLICTGKVKHGEDGKPNYGEGVFQNTGATTEEKLADLEYKQERLIYYIKCRTDFDCRYYKDISNISTKNRYLAVKKVEVKNVVVCY